MNTQIKWAIGIGSVLTLVGLGFLYSKNKKNKEDEASNKSVDSNSISQENINTSEIPQQKSVSKPTTSVVKITKPISRQSIGVKKGVATIPASVVNKQYDVLEDKDYDKKIVEINAYREKVSKLKPKSFGTAIVVSGYRKLKDETLLPMNLVDLKDYLNLFYLEAEKGLDVRQKALKAKLEKKYPEISFPPSAPTVSGFSGVNDYSDLDLPNAEKLELC